MTRPPAVGRSTAVRWLLLAALAACARGPAVPEAPAEPERPAGAEPPAEAAPEDTSRAVIPTREPFVRVGVAVGVDSVTVGSASGLRLLDPAAGGPPGRLAPGRTAVVRPGEGGVVLGSGPDAAARRLLRLEAEEEGSGVRLDGRRYGGAIDLYRVENHGLVAVNQLPLEEYLLGVVPLEIGPREASEAEAVRAQAVAARTYAVRHLGRRDSLGFDVFGSVEDQVYGGRDAERPLVDRAVAATSGEVLVWRGAPARAYYHSTGGGHTARVSDVWELDDAPYLRRVSDRRPGGGDFCDISPRYAWEVAWTAGELEAAVAAGVERHYGIEAPPGRVTGIRVTGRTAHGRVTGLEVSTEGGRWRLEKNDIRFFLRTPEGRVLGSTRFRVLASPPDVEGLRLAGRGWGHGIGMCQWGAIGRARAGLSYREILAHYYPGTELRKAY